MPASKDLNVKTDWAFHLRDFYLIYLNINDAPRCWRIVAIRYVHVYCLNDLKLRIFSILQNMFALQSVKVWLEFSGFFQVKLSYACKCISIYIFLFTGTQWPRISDYGPVRAVWDPPKAGPGGHEPASILWRINLDE